MPRAMFSTPALYAGALVLASLAGVGAYLALTPEGGRPAGSERAADLADLAAQIGDSRKLELFEASKPFENIAFTDEAGAAAALSDFKGRIVLLNFWATFCGPCLEEMPALDALHRDLGGEDFAVVAVSLDRGAPDRPLGWLKENGIAHLAFYQDRSMQSAATAGLKGMPTTVLLDREGREIARLLGAAAWDGEHAKALIQALIEAEPSAS